MSVESARFDADGGIVAVVEGQEWRVPDVAGNRLRVEIAAWEAEGHTIMPYVAPQEVAAEPTRDLLAEIDALKAALVGNKVLSEQAIQTADARSLEDGPAHE